MIQKYKLNLHAHTRYSDGNPTILELATEYKRLGFTCAVISDHYYGSKDLEHYSMTLPKYKEAIIDGKEAEQNLGYPVIIGMEYGFFRCEEVLCFGHEFHLKLYEGVKSIDEFIQLRKEYESACVLCHPNLSDGENGFIGRGGHLCIDGFEHYNSGQNYFKNIKSQFTRKVPKEFKDLTAFSNSDAHSLSSLPRGHNLIDEPIETESKLIEYIVKKKPVKPLTERLLKVSEDNPSIP